MANERVTSRSSLFIRHCSLSSVAAAAAAAVARGQIDRDAVGAKAGLCLDAPVPGAVVVVVEVLLVRILDGRDVHALVAQAEAVHPGREFGRCEMFHDASYALSVTGLRPAICMMARFTAVFVICT